MDWKIFLSGEIHSGWRDDLIQAARDRKLPVTFFTPVTDHEASDNVGVKILGAGENPFRKDHKAAWINAIRIRRGIGNVDVVIVKFGEQYRQWNATYDADVAVASGKPLIVIHPEEFNHALKEIDSQAMAVARDEQQVIEILEYVITKK